MSDVISPSTAQWQNSKDAALAPSGIYPISIATSYGNNLCLWSEEFQNAVWFGQVGDEVVTANTDLGNDGTTTADTITLPSATSAYAQTVSTNTTAGNQYTFSVWVKGSGTLYISLWDNATGYQNGSVITLSGTLTRYSITATYDPASTTRRVYIRRNSGTATSVKAWGAQLQTGATLSSTYGKTTSAPVTIPSVVTAYGFTDDVSLSDAVFTADVNGNLQISTNMSDPAAVMKLLGNRILFTSIP